jgi:hypothetical protein
MRFETKRLIKDLPFMKRDTVWVKCNNTYQMNNGETQHSGNLFSYSSNGIVQLNEIAKDLVDTIWDNEKWFEDADFSEAKWRVEDKIEIYFDNAVDKEKLISIAKIMYMILKENFRATAIDMGHDGAPYLGIFDGENDGGESE